MLGETSWIITRTWHEAGYGVLWMPSRSFAVHSLYFWLSYNGTVEYHGTRELAGQMPINVQSNCPMFFPG